MGVWLLKNSIVYGTVLLTGSGLLLRLVAMGFQVYLSGRIGAAGIGLLQLILSVRRLAATAGAAGVRTCAVYLSAEASGRRRPHEVRAVLTSCCRYALVSSTLIALCLWRAAAWLADVWIGAPAAAPSLRLAALFLPVQCLCGVLTGYLTSAGRIRSLIRLEFLEQGITILLTYLLLSRWAGGDAGRACLAVTAGGCAAALPLLFLLAALCRRGLPRQVPEGPVPYRRIIRMALPLAIADDLRAGLDTAEDLIIPKRLALFTTTAAAMAEYGVVRGMVFPVLMFPSAILFSLAELLIPEFSRCSAGRRVPRVRYLARRSLRITLLFGLGVGGMLLCIAGPLGTLLYQDPRAGAGLRLYAPFVPVLYLDIIVDAICKGLGLQDANARRNALTSFLDVILLWSLLPRAGMGGYYLCFAITHLLNFLLSLRCLIRAADLRLDGATVVRAVLCAVAAAAGTAALPQGGRIIDIVLSGVCYLSLLVLLWLMARVIGRGDVLWLCDVCRRRRSR